MSVFADVTDEDGSIDNVKLNWGTTSWDLSTTITMTGVGDTYTTDTDIPAQPNNTTVYFEIVAEDNEGGISISLIQSYVLPATTTIPYMETFDNDLGNCHVYSVLGESKTWEWGYNGTAYISGYNSGEIEEDWLVLPAVDLDTYTNQVLTFDTWWKYGSGPDADNHLVLRYSTDYQGTGDPTSATWLPLTFSVHDAEVWGSSGPVDLSGISGDQVYLAFKYRYDVDEWRTWKIDNIDIDYGNIDITFEVNMQNETPSADGVFLVGDFSPDYPDWDLGDLPMDDTDGDLIYTITLSLNSNRDYQYKYVNGLSWDDAENPPSACTAEGNTNRQLTTGIVDETLDLVCYSACGDCGGLPYYQSFDNSLGDCTSESVSGDTKYWEWFSGGGSVASMYGNDSGELEEDWLILPPLNLDESTDEKMTFDTWWGNGGNDENNYLKLLYSTDYPGTGNPNDYTWDVLSFNQAPSGGWEFSGLVDLSSISGSEVYIAYKYHYNPGSYVWWAVDDIAIFEGELIDVTFQVNMEEETVSTDGVHIAGSFNDWNTSDTELSDDDGDGVYTTTLSLYSGIEYTFKYLNGNDWGTEETVPGECAAPNTSNRFETIGVEDYSVDVVCFGSCTDCGLNNITFRVDMQNETVSEEGVYLAGDFTNWGNAPLMMSQEGNIWSVTVTLPRTTTQNYKFVNGDPNGGSPNWEDFSGDCTTGSYNDRFFVVPNENIPLDLVCFNSCDACPSSPLIFSEIGLPYDNSNGKFVELYNAGGSTIDFDTEVWYLCRQANGNPDSWGDFRLSGSLAAGGTLTIVPDEAGFNDLYAPLTANLESSITNVGGGNDGFFLYAGGDHSNGTLIDAYGVLDENGNGAVWNYDGTKAVRLRWVNTPSPDWLFWEWNIPESAGSDQTTPGEHKSDVTWQGTTDGDWHRKGDNWSGTYGYVPDASFNVTIPDVAEKPVVNNQAACNNLTINTGSYLIVSVTIFDIYGNLDVNSGATFYLFATQTQNSSVIVQGTATGFTRMTRYFGGYNEESNGWHNISSPVDNLAIAGSYFEPGNNDDLYQWDEPTSTWENYKQGHFTNFENGKGYLNAFEESGYKHFEGTLNTDDIAISGLTKDLDGFHLLGNPFSSSIRWDDGNWNLNNIGAVAQIWDESNNNYAQIVQYETIPSTNGFFVEVGTATGSLTIPKYARVHDMVDNYKKVESKDDLVETLDFKLTNDENTYYDNCRVGIKSDATYEWDIQYDVHKLPGGSGTSQIWSVIDDEKFVFNYLPYVEAAYQLPIYFKAGVNGTHHINIEGIESFHVNNDIYLEDLFTGLIINLSEQQTYSFSASTADNTDRFILHFFGVTSVDDGLLAGNYQLYSFNNIIYIRCDQIPESDFQVNVFNTIGQLVYSTSMSAGILNSFSLNERAGIYIVQVRTTEGIRSHKIMIR